MDIVPICDGEAHLQNEVSTDGCYVCGKKETGDMVLIRTEEKKFRFACLDHPNIAAEFVRQYKRVPLGWIYLKGEDDGNKSNGEELKG